jgi:hypothetical protein
MGNTRGGWWLLLAILLLAQISGSAEARWKPPASTRAGVGLPFAGKRPVGEHDRLIDNAFPNACSQACVAMVLATQGKAIRQGKRAINPKRASSSAACDAVCQVSSNIARTCAPGAPESHGYSSSQGSGLYNTLATLRTLGGAGSLRASQTVTDLGNNTGARRPAIAVMNVPDERAGVFAAGPFALWAPFNPFVRAYMDAVSNATPLPIGHAVVVDKVQDGRVYVRDPGGSSTNGAEAYSVSASEFRRTFTGCAIYTGADGS